MNSLGKLKFVQFFNQPHTLNHTYFVVFIFRIKSHHDKEIEDLQNELAELRLHIHELEEQREMICTSVTTILEMISQKSIFQPLKKCI